MRSLILLISVFSFFAACETNDKIKNDYTSYVYDTLKLQPNTNGYDYFVILNPKSGCTVCYLQSIKNAVKLKDKYPVKFITNCAISIFINDTQLTRYVDDECKFSKINPNESIN